MSDMPLLPEVPAGHYRHFKGGDYDVLGVVRHSETLEPLVLYRPRKGDGAAWVRPHAMFFEQVEHEGRTMPRFARIDATPDAP